MSRDQTRFYYYYKIDKKNLKTSQRTKCVRFRQIEGVSPGFIVQDWKLDYRTSLRVKNILYPKTIRPSEQISLNTLKFIESLFCAILSMVWKDANGKNHHHLPLAMHSHLDRTDIEKVLLKYTSVPETHYLPLPLPWMRPWVAVAATNPPHRGPPPWQRRPPRQAYPPPNGHGPATAHQHSRTEQVLKSEPNSHALTVEVWTFGRLLQYLKMSATSKSLSAHRNQQILRYSTQVHEEQRNAYRQSRTSSWAALACSRRAAPGPHLLLPNPPLLPVPTVPLPSVNSQPDRIREANHESLERCRGIRGVPRALVPPQLDPLPSPVAALNHQVVMPRPRARHLRLADWDPLQTAVDSPQPPITPLAQPDTNPKPACPNLARQTRLPILAWQSTSVASPDKPSP